MISNSGNSLDSSSLDSRTFSSILEFQLPGLLVDVVFEFEKTQI